jgi:small GTP-binding protein
MTKITIVVLGQCVVGKTPMIEQYVCGTFSPYNGPHMDESYRTDIRIHENNYRLEIIDISGGDDFSNRRSGYIRQGKGFLLVYSITSRISFEEIENIYRDILRKKERSQVPIVICGNMCDREYERQVSTEEGKELARRLHCPFYETSGRANTNIQNAFLTLVEEIEKIENLAHPPKQSNEEQQNKEQRNKEQQNKEQQNKEFCSLL